MSDDAKTTTPAAGAAGDIIFDCPHCNKSLAIDPRGAGLVITCPDCSQPVQVPGLPLEEREGVRAGEVDDEEDESVPVDMPAASGDLQKRVGDLEEALEASHAKVARLVESLEEVRERRRYLEKLRTDNIARFKQIGKELETIQHAMDRIVAHLQDAAAESGTDGG